MTTSPNASILAAIIICVPLTGLQSPLAKASSSYFNASSALSTATYAPSRCYMSVTFVMTNAAIAPSKCYFKAKSDFSITASALAAASFNVNSA